MLDVLESREKAAVVKFLRESRESGLLAHVIEVTSDMWNGYVEAAREVFGPSVTLTIDRFHVMKNLQDRLTAARALGLTALNKFCDTLERWLDKIANYFVSRSSNGPTEGFNNGLRTILRRTFGMLNFRHFRLRVLDRFGKPQTQEST